MEVNAGAALAEPSALPAGWHTVLLDLVAKRGSGHTPSKGRPEYWNGGVKWVSLADSAALDHVYIEDTAASISEAGLQNSSAVMHSAGTVVLSRDAGVGKSAILRTDMAVSQHFMAWLCGPELHNFYLYYWLQSRKPDFERIAAGSTIKTIGLPYFQSLEVVKPPLLEQQAIAKALTDADTLIDSLEQLLTKQRQIKQGAMQELLTGKRRLPGFKDRWDTRQLADVVRMKSGNAITADHMADGAAFPCYGGNGLRGYTSTFTHEGTYALIGRQGALCGNVVLVSGKFYASEHAVVVTASDAIDITWLHFILIRMELNRFAESSAQPGLSVGKVLLLELEVPSVAEQHAIAQVLTDMDASLTALQARLTKARQLKQALMQVLLTGRIRLVAPRPVEGAAA